MSFTCRQMAGSCGMRRYYCRINSRDLAQESTAGILAYLLAQELRVQLLDELVEPRRQRD